jgi:nitrite reductase/ring-hydroxylating ferredoxin subunit
MSIVDAHMSATGEQIGVVVCAADELEPGEMVGARLGLLPVVIIRTSEGELHALEDRCLHQGARLSRGRLLPAAEGDAVGRYGMDDSREVIKCPWHGYEYDVRTGCAVFDRRRALRRVRVVEQNGLVLAFRDAD